MVSRRAPAWCYRLPAYALNGIGVAIGVALIELLAGLAGGWSAALTASSSAIVTSLADLPNAPSRTWRRTLTAALIGCTISVLMTALHVAPVTLGIATGVIAFLSAMTLAWGPRAGPISFVGVLALVFTMAAPPAHGVLPWFEHAAWSVFGGALYLGWAVAVSVLLQPRYRTLALATALDALARLLRSRTALLDAEPSQVRGPLPLQDWITGQVSLDESLQAARDLLFPLAAVPSERHRIVMLLTAVDMRDTLLASELDVELLPDDASTRRLRADLVDGLVRIATALEGIGAALRSGRAGPGADALDWVDAPDAGDDTPLTRALRVRARHLVADLQRLRRAQRGDASALKLSAAQLQLFVSPEGWPLKALAPHATLASPVLRHALRVGVALAFAYFLARALPWGSHPQWLVLSVAVVLRGNLEQTLARRDARIAGTVIGCLLVLALAWSHAPLWLSLVVLVVAVGTGHSFTVTRYLVTAAAATVTALLQAHLANPVNGFGIGERLADTVLGALLAFGFGYVLPSWERRSMGRLVDRVQSSLRALAVEVVRWPEPDAPELELRLARRDVYDAIGHIATAAQRTGAEPERVRLPLYALSTLLSRCHVLLAQLAAVRTMLMREGERLDPAAARRALGAAALQLQALLQAGSVPALDVGPLPPVGLRAAPPPPDDAEALQPWLERRLEMVVLAAAAVMQAAAGVRAAAP